ncbi:rCG27249, partial [Rattus norvegicus]
MLLRKESGEGSTKNNSKLQRNMVFSSPSDFFLLCDGVGVGQQTQGLVHARQALEQGFVLISSSPCISLQILIRFLFL